MGVLQSALSLFHRAKDAAAVSTIHLTRGPRKLWANNLDEELAWWDEYLRTRGEATGHAAGFCKRMNPDEPLQPNLAEYLRSDNPKLIDVGAGPVTTLGKTLGGRRLDIVAVDSLADRYNELLDRYGLVPPVRTAFAESERLTDLFPLGTFDLAHARNTLDHALIRR